MPDASKYELAAYADPASAAPVFRLSANPQFSPLDVNVAFLAQNGWNQSVDRLRFHTRGASAVAPDDPLARVVTRFEPDLLIRRLDRDEDCFASVHAYVDGDIVVLSNDADFARVLFQGIFLECPPSFHTLGNSRLPKNGSPTGRRKLSSPACWLARKVGTHLTTFPTAFNSLVTKPGGHLKSQIIGPA